MSDTVSEMTSRGRSWACSAIAVVVLLASLALLSTHQRSSDPETTTSTFLSPANDMGYLSIKRVRYAGPSSVWGDKLGKQPLPTNIWYLNLVSHKAGHNPDESKAWAFIGPSCKLEQ